MKTIVISIRIKEDLYSKIKKIAADENRTTTGQINQLLKKSLENQKQAKKGNQETGFTSQTRKGMPYVICGRIIK